MNERKPLLFVFLLSFLLNGCLSAIILGFEEDNKLAELYLKMRGEGIHIPVLLHMNEDKKGVLCADIMGSAAMKAADIEHVDITIPDVKEAVERLPNKENYFRDGNRLYPVDVHEMFIPISSDSNEEPLEKKKLSDDIAMECLVTERQNGKLSTVVYLISYAFRKRSYFVSKKLEGGARILALAELSPDYEKFDDQKALEDYYLSLRMPLEKIGEEWPTVKQTYEKQDNLSVLTEDELTLLCASVFEAGYYKERSIIFSGEKPDKERKAMVLDFEAAELAPQPQPLTTDNIVCQGEENGVVKLFYLTRSLNAEYSIFVQKQKGEHVVLDTYIKNISLLMHTAFRPTTEQLNMPS